MSFEAAALVATIQLGGDKKAGQDLDAFKAKLEQTDTAAGKIGRTADAAFRMAANSISVASVAAAAYVSKLFATGVAYNQLQQTSRAALRTLLGGAEQANAQMDKLDAFARTSPFSKSVFISAQQQLIGFGFEAQKVIPILSAVQDATAAVGGSNEQISEIVSILAKIRSSGKLTAEDLNMLGERGLDAATLLGQGFGKSAADIRESITKGTLDAGEAVDVLVDQMGKKFSGAAANVKETFAGTTDRIKAASRDIGAALAEPFVSKNGGGLFVTWGNQVADVLRAVEKQVPPVVSILTSRAQPAFANITELLDRARVQVKSWDSSRLEHALDQIAINGPAVAVTAGAILGVNAQLLASIPIVGRFVPAFSPLGGALTAAALASPELRAALSDLLATAKPLIPVGVDLARMLSGTLSAALPVAAGAIETVAEVAKPIIGIFSAIPGPVLASVAAAVAVTAAMKAGAPAIEGWVDGVRRIGEQVAVQAALGAMEGNTSRLGGAFGFAGKAATGLGNSLKAAFITNPVGLIILGVSTAAAILTAVLAAQGQKTQETKERIQGYRDTLDQTSGAIQRATRAQVDKNLSDTNARALADKLGVSYRDVVAAILGEEAANDRVTAAIEENGKVRGRSVREVGAMSAGSKELTQLITDQKSALAEATEQTKRDNDEKRKAAAAMSEVERSNSRMNEALGIARDVSKDATERLKGLKQALDELNGGAKTQAEVTRDLHEQTAKLKEAFSQTNEAGEKLAKGLVNSSGEIDTTTAAGWGLFDQVKSLNDQMLNAILLADKEAKARGESGVSMDKAREIAGKYQGTLRDVAGQAGLSQEQVDGLVKTMLDTPEVVAFAVKDDGTVDAAKLRLINLAQQIITTPNGQFEVKNEDIPGLTEALKLLGVDITTLPEGTIKVKKDDGSFNDVAKSLRDLVAERVASIKAAVSVSYGQAGNVGGTLARAGGGPVHGPGSTTSDSILSRLSNDEHVWSAAETRGAGGHGAVAQMRALARSGQLTFPAFRDGGPVIIPSRLPSVTYSIPTSPSQAQVATSTGAVQAGDVFNVDMHVTANPTQSIEAQAMQGADRLLSVVRMRGR